MPRGIPGVPVGALIWRTGRAGALAEQYCHAGDIVSHRVGGKPGKLLAVWQRELCTTPFATIEGYPDPIPMRYVHVIEHVPKGQADLDEKPRKRKRSALKKRTDEPTEDQSDADD